METPEKEETGSPGRLARDDGALIQNENNNRNPPHHRNTTDRTLTINKHHNTPTLPWLDERRSEDSSNEEIMLDLNFGEGNDDTENTSRSNRGNSAVGHHHDHPKQRSTKNAKGTLQRDPKSVPSLSLKSRASSFDNLRAFHSEQRQFLHHDSNGMNNSRSVEDLVSFATPTTSTSSAAAVCTDMLERLHLQRQQEPSGDFSASRQRRVLVHTSVSSIPLALDDSSFDDHHHHGISCGDDDGTSSSSPRHRRPSFQQSRMPSVHLEPRSRHPEEVDHHPHRYRDPVHLSTSFYATETVSAASLPPSTEQALQQQPHTPNQRVLRTPTTITMDSYQQQMQDDDDALQTPMRQQVLQSASCATASSSAAMLHTPQNNRSNDDSMGDVLATPCQTPA